MALGCVGGALASFLNDLVTWADESGVEQEPVPVLELPPDLEPTGPDTDTSHDDPPPDDPGNSSDGTDLSQNDFGEEGGSGSGGPARIDDDDPELHEA